MLTISEAKKDTCVWCRKEGDGVVAKFSDGLAGFLCWKDLKNAVKVRTNGKPAQSEGRGNAAQR